MRSLLRWIQLGENLHKMQSFPHAEATEDFRADGARGPTSTRAGNLQSVSGGIVTYQGITLKTFLAKAGRAGPCLRPRRSWLPWLRPVKSCCRLGACSTRLKNGIPLDALGCPKTQHHSLKMELFTDSQSAQSITAMYGLLRRVKHVELRYAFLQHLVQQKRLRVHFVPRS